MPQSPDECFLTPMEMNCVEKDVVSRIKNLYKDKRRMIIGRTANLTVPHNGLTNCQYRNRCDLGCPFGGYFSTQAATLSAAVLTGNLTVRPWSIVTRVLYDKAIKRAKGVEVLDAETNLTYQYKAKIIFLNAATFNTALILMNSATDVWSGVLGSSNGELGHNIIDHHVGDGASGEVVGLNISMFMGEGQMVFIFQNTEICLGTKEIIYAKLVIRVGLVERVEIEKFQKCNGEAPLKKQ